MKRFAFNLALCCLFLAGDAGAASMTPEKVKSSDKCPVCGMFVAKFPDFIARIIFRDGTYAAFDGAKDMFKYHQNMPKYTKKTRSDVVSVLVTDYYGLKEIDATKAYFVAGSDVYGPMGRELIPFLSSADAEEFMRDHKGKRIFRFGDISPTVIKGFD